MYYYLDDNDSFVESMKEPEFENVSFMMLILDETPKRYWRGARIIDTRSGYAREARIISDGRYVWDEEVEVPKMSDIDLHKLEQNEEQTKDSIGNILRIVDFLTSRPNVTKYNISIEDAEGDREVRCDISWEK